MRLDKQNLKTEVVFFLSSTIILKKNLKGFRPNNNLK